jgi:hypothetical protein
MNLKLDSWPLGIAVAWCILIASTALFIVLKH